MRSSMTKFCILLVCVFLCSRGMNAQSQSLKVLVLDALDGKPQANVKVEYFCMGPPLNSAPKIAVTDKEGSAEISDFCSDKQEIDISIYPPNKKEQCGVGPITLKDILSVGAVAHLDADGGIWCPTKVSKKLKPVPGQVILFIKEPTWWQSHVAG